jgi:site-specific DNA-methyltransferase (adenine-specific)
MSRTETLAEGVTLYCGDCREILPTLGKVDAVVTDPPYGIGFKYESYQDTAENLRDIVDEVIVPAIASAERALVFCSHGKTQDFPKADWIGCVTWNTTGSYGKLGVCQWTPILFYGRDLPGFGSVNGGVLKSDVISISGGDGVGFRRGETIDHPCPKPVNMMVSVAARYTLPGETILDPFMGSGTTGVAAVKLGRKFIGIEIEPKYFDIACKRIQAALDAPDMFVEQPKPAVQEAMKL